LIQEIATESTAAAAAAAVTTPLQPLSPGQRFPTGKHMRVIADTTPGISSAHATGILFATVENYERGGVYTVKAGCLVPRR
jgi:hypothetical protein